VCSPSPAIWFIDIDLTRDAESRFDRYAAGHRGTAVSIVAGSVLLISPTLDQASFRGTLSIGDMNLTQEDASRIVAAISGPKTTARGPASIDVCRRP